MGCKALLCLMVVVVLLMVKRACSCSHLIWKHAPQLFAHIPTYVCTYENFLRLVLNRTHTKSHYLEMYCTYVHIKYAETAKHTICTARKEPYTHTTSAFVEAPGTDAVAATAISLGICLGSLFSHHTRETWEKNSLLPRATCALVHLLRWTKYSCIYLDQTLNHPHQPNRICSILSGALA